MSWSIGKVRLPLKFTWKISRNSSDYKENFIVRYNEDGLEGAGEVAFNVRYGESVEQIEEEFASFQKRYRKTHDPRELHAELVEFNTSKSLRFGIESAFIAALADEKNQTISEYLGLAKRDAVPTSFSLPILEVDEIEEFFNHHDLSRFKSLKIKVDKEAEKRVREVARHYKGPLRVDANEAWHTADEVMRFVETAGDLNIEFIEQPLPANEHEELKKLRLRCDIPLIGDESLTDEGVSEYHVERFHGVNVKLMKAGGLMPALEQLETARKLGLQTMLGCMVETSLGISKALHLSDRVDYIDLDGFLLLKDDPQKKVTEKDGLLFF